MTNNSYQSLPVCTSPTEEVLYGTDWAAMGGGVHFCQAKLVINHHIKQSLVHPPLPTHSELLEEDTETGVKVRGGCFHKSRGCSQIIFIQLIYDTVWCSDRWDMKRRRAGGGKLHARSNDFRGHSKKGGKVFIHHYCHGLWQMITICLHSYF